MQRSILLWIAAGLVAALNVFAAIQQDVAVIYAALLLNGAMALGGIGFGIWVGRTLARARPLP